MTASFSLRARHDGLHPEGDAEQHDGKGGAGDAAVPSAGGRCRGCQAAPVHLDLGLTSTLPVAAHTLDNCLFLELLHQCTEHYIAAY